MQPFNLSAALTGAKLITKCGVEATNFRYVKSGSFMVDFGNTTWACDGDGMVSVDIGLGVSLYLAEAPV